MCYLCLNLRTTIEVIWPWVWNRITRFSVANLSSCNTENRKFVETLCNDLCFFGKRLHDRCHQKMLFRKNLLFCLVFVLVYLLFHPYPQTIHVHYVNYHQCMSKDKRTVLMSIFIFNSLLFCILLCTSYLLSALSPLSAYSAKNCCLICFWTALFTYFYHPHIIIIYRSSLNVSQK